MFQKSIIGVLLILSSVATLAAPTLPFIGKRSFQFTDGNANGQAITIKANGQVTIITQGMIKPYLNYKGTYKPVMIGNDGGGRYKVVGKFIYSLDEKNQVLRDCEKMVGEEIVTVPCQSELYPF